MKYIVIHCADSPNEREITAEDIHAWHKLRKFDGIGYHHVIRRNGLVENGRPHYWPGAHVKGHNTGSIGICLVGRDEFSDSQFQSLRDLVQHLVRQYPEAEVLGHRDLYSGKTCPNFDARAWWERVSTCRCSCEDVPNE